MPCHVSLDLSLSLYTYYICVFIYIARFSTSRYLENVSVSLSILSVLLLLIVNIKLNHIMYNIFIYALIILEIIDTITYV